ncbi:hypothetical protein [Brucella gallinifaecis]|uniref:hypothetical protein n=1 Tax=Brucella gallinifaecis TaxID=215590 RepID=UPI002360CE3D|nr:hypothetical protein [Brucella gallinifaecis]
MADGLRILWGLVEGLGQMAVMDFAEPQITLMQTVVEVAAAVVVLVVELAVMGGGQERELRVRVPVI